ncbi:hypothetical protein ABZ468_09665 [Streptomyces sp. NPDC005708]|uniref:hypothetical protein n=1 Tax=unclassified Streptomyces TaxID=2593676 RepID=UPI0033FDC8A6
MLSGPDVQSPTAGYRSTVEPDAVDAVRFEGFVIVGRVHAEDGPGGCGRLRLRRGVREVGLQDRAAFDAASSGSRGCA